MKKRISLCLLVIFTSFILGCGSDDAEPKPNEFTADVYVDGEGDMEFEADEDDIFGLVDGDEVVIQAEAPNDFDGGGFIYLSFDLDDIEEGETYDLLGSTDIDMFMVHDGSDNGIISGEITFDKVSNKRIEATFEFTTYSGYYEANMEVTDGELKVTLEEGNI